MYYLSKILFYEDGQYYFDRPAYAVLDGNEIEEHEKVACDFQSKNRLNGWDVTMSKTLERCFIVEGETTHAEKIANGDCEIVQISKEAYDELSQKRTDDASVVFVQKSPDFFVLYVTNDYFNEEIGEIVY